MNGAESTRRSYERPVQEVLLRLAECTARVAELEDLAGAQREDIESLNAIVERLSAPPVVPEGWDVTAVGSVSRFDQQGGRHLVTWVDTQVKLMDRPAAIPIDVMAAAIWAARTHKRPPHTGDDRRTELEAAERQHQRRQTAPFQGDE